MRHVALKEFIVIPNARDHRHVLRQTDKDWRNY